MCEVQGPSQTQLPADARAPGVARAFLRAAACETHHARVVDDAELLVSELVTNAVLHGAPPITMRVECDGSNGLRVSVTDRSADPAGFETRTPLTSPAAACAWSTSSVTTGGSSRAPASGRTCGSGFGADTRSWRLGGPGA